MAELRHDPNADALYVEFAPGPPARTDEVGLERRVDYATDGTPLGIEILDPSYGVVVDGLPRADDVAELVRQAGLRIVSVDQRQAAIDAALAADPRWVRLAFAREVGRAVSAYRAQHDLGVRELGRLLHMAPSAIVNLEVGEHNPSIEMLRRLARVLGLRFALEIVPPGQDPAFLDSAAAITGSVESGRLLVRAG